MQNSTQMQPQPQLQPENAQQVQTDQQAERYKRELKFLQQEVKRIQTLHDQKDQELITLKKLKEPT